MQASVFDEEAMFRSIDEQGIRVLLIGRRALVALGLPVLTADYDLWVHGDDITKLNGALAPFDLVPSKSPDEARATGRYVLENDEHIDVLVARQASTVNGVVLTFDDAWARRQAIPYAAGLYLSVPSIPDLILTKQWSMRRKDIDDIDMLEKLARGDG